MKNNKGKPREGVKGLRGVRRAVWRLAALLVMSVFAAPQALALGLGQAQVQSYLQQPLVARIDLISRSEAEMATVTAGLASPSDFQVLGLTRDAIATPLEFEIYPDLSDPHIRVTSRLPMDEPVVQLVVEVVWASGRMLRQYTLFLDPPTFDAPAPLPSPGSLGTESTRVAPPPPVELAAAESQPEARQQDLPASTVSAPETTAPDADRRTVAIEPVEPPAAPSEVPAAGPPFDPAADVPLAAQPEESAPLDPIEAVELDDLALPEALPPESIDSPAAVTPEVVAESSDSIVEEVPATAAVVEEQALASEPQASTDPLPLAPSDDALAEAVEETSVPTPVDMAQPSVEPAANEVAEAPAPAQPYRAVLPEPLQPLSDTIDVQRGDTLWGLSSDYAETQGVSINQVMLAVQQKNPDAFIQGNINAMIAGEILRMPTRDEVLTRSAREAMLEVLRQESVYRTRWDLPPSPDALPVISNLADTGSGTNAASPVELEQPAVPAAEEADAAEDDSRLVLVPPTEGEPEATQGTGQGGSGETGVSSGESVVEELARAREELANAQQEKAYLEDRLAELEAELARRETEAGRGVADTSLAEMEERLRGDRLAGEEKPELALPKRETSWLSNFGPALAGLMVLALVTLVWFLRSRRDPAFTPGLEEPVSGADSTVGEEIDTTETSDTESDDPETLLDLARAYLAMGKNSQARDCIEAVTRMGTPTQVREARTMLSEL